MTRDDLEAMNWQALARYGNALSQPGAHISRIQSRFIDELTVAAQEFRAAGIREALNPVPAQVLVGQAIDVLAGAMGVRPDKAKPKKAKTPSRKATPIRRTA